MYGSWSNCSNPCGVGVRVKESICQDADCTGYKPHEMEEPCDTWNITTCPSKWNYEEMYFGGATEYIFVTSDMLFCYDYVIRCQKK